MIFLTLSSLAKNSKTIDIENPFENIIEIEGVDYVVCYLNNVNKKSKGGNSYILTLHNAQEFEENGYDKPDLVLKLSKYQIVKRKKKGNERFENEIKALFNCNEKKFQNVISVYHTGVIQIIKKGEKNKKSPYYFKFPFYSMEFAKGDLKMYIENTQPDLYKRIDLCLEIANGLKELVSEGYYHRDLKPDNIFVNDTTWKIGDLGLVDHREGEYLIDSINEIIGPRGWLSPEAMNKYLTMDKELLFKYDCKIDHQSDIFQLGKIFWYILQGNAPIGCVNTKDFKIKDSKLFPILKTMLNHSKIKRYKTIDEVIKLLKPIHLEYLKS
jgi:serine/threonine protein kinase